MSTTEPGRLREVRFSLKTLLAEVTVERRTGSFGVEKLRPQEVRKLFHAKSRKKRADNN